MMINMIAAIDSDNIIGYNGKLPWGNNLKADLTFFKKITKNSVVVMGRKTYDSLGKDKLPGRSIIVISSQYISNSLSCIDLMQKGTTKTIYINPEERNSNTGELMLDSLIKYMQNDKYHNYMIAGGESIYKMFLDVSSYVYITTVLSYPQEKKQTNQKLIKKTETLTRENLENHGFHETTYGANPKDLKLPDDVEIYDNNHNLLYSYRFTMWHNLKMTGVHFLKPHLKMFK